MQLIAQSKHKHLHCPPSSDLVSRLQDLFAIGAIIAFIYFIFQVYTEISKLK